MENIEDNQIEVLHLIPNFFPKIGGAEIVVYTIGKTLIEKGVRTSVLTRKFRETPEYEVWNGIKIYRFKNPMPEKWKDYSLGKHKVSQYGKLSVNLFDLICSIKKCNKLSKKYDILHVSFPLPLGIPALISKKTHHIPVVITVHGNADIYQVSNLWYPIIKQILDRVDIVVSVSKDLAEYLKNEVKIQNEIKIIENGIDINKFRPRNEKNDYSGFTIISVSRLVERKNIDILIKAVHLANKERYNIKLLIAGTGPEEEKLKRLADKAGNCIKMVGRISEDEKIELLSKADLFAQLSVREGLSIATLEALACGLPVLVSDIRGVREPIDPETGFLVRDPCDCYCVKEKIEEIYERKQEVLKMKLKAREKAVKKYSNETMAMKYHRLYKSIMRDTYGRI